MTNPLDPLDRRVSAPAERPATPPYGLLAVFSGYDAATLRANPEYLEVAQGQMAAFVERYFGDGANPSEAEVRARVGQELGRYVPALAGTPNLGTQRATLVQRLGVSPEARLLELFEAAERRWPTRVPTAPPRNLITPAPSSGVALDPPRSLDPVQPRVVEPAQDPQALATERAARRQRNLADMVDLWRSLPSDKSIYPVQKDEYRAHMLSELERIYGSRAAGLEAMAVADPAVAAEMGRWVRPPLPTGR